LGRWGLPGQTIQPFLRRGYRIPVAGSRKEYTWDGGGGTLLSSRDGGTQSTFEKANDRASVDVFGRQQARGGLRPSVYWGGNSPSKMWASKGAKLGGGLVTEGRSETSMKIKARTRPTCTKFDRIPPEDLGASEKLGHGP